MKKQMKQIAAVSMAVCLTASMAGCASGSEEEEGRPGAPHIGIIFTQAGLGGNSFNDLALEGVKQAARISALPMIRWSRNPWPMRRSFRTRWRLRKNMT